MDMSFSLGDAAPLAAPPLRYEALLAAIRETAGTAGTAAIAAPALVAPSAVCLADVLLGRPGWREASLALGGSFAGGSRSDAQVSSGRKPV